MTEETRATMLEVAYDIIHKVYKDLCDTMPRGGIRENMLYEFQDVMNELFSLTKRVRGNGAKL